MQNQPPTELLDNTQISPATGRYVAHVAVACRDVREAAEWYSSVVGAKSVRILDDRVTLSVGGVLQMVCHLAPDCVNLSPHPYPRHVGLTFFARRGLCAHVGSPPFDKHPFLLNPMTRFPLNKHEHQSFMLTDPSGNVIEFKWYLNSEHCY